LSRRRQLDELPSAIARVTGELEAIEGEWERVQEILSKQRQNQRTQEHVLKEAEEARREGERSFAEVHTLASRLGSQMEFVASELTRVDEELNALLGTLQEAQTSLQGSSQEEERLKGHIADCDRLVTLHRSRQQELQREVAEVRVRSTSLQERREALSRSMERLEEDLARERNREAEIHQEEEEGRSRQTQLVQEVATLQHSLEGLRQQEAREAPAVQTLQQERDQLRENIIAHEEALKAARRELAGVQEQQTSIATRRTALITERSLLQKRLEEESEGGEPREDRADLPDDPQALQEEAEELRQKVGAMGPINMAALEEYQAVSERYRFLKDQAEDLTTSVTSLKATIAEINRTIEERFGQTLTSVNEHLNRFWQRLFEGGEAEIVLIQEEESAEPGVEIRVRIPGKRTTTLSLLSGGEKSLGAIALLMALWAVRPSPFVVLDEVDAALDDPNIERFVSLLRELARTSQIILITHHPRTMEVADLLYGITMEERGISKLISVRLGQQAEQAAPASVP
ncbi:MAG: AAA family ATPase, partial [Candidatus Methylomirabilales bacterium]